MRICKASWVSFESVYEYVWYLHVILVIKELFLFPSFKIYVKRFVGIKGPMCNFFGRFGDQGTKLSLGLKCRDSFQMVHPGTLFTVVPDFKPAPRQCYIPDIIRIFFKEIWESPQVNSTSVRFEPTTSGIDPPILYRLSHEASMGAGRGN